MQGFLGERAARGGAVAQLEFADDVVAEAPLPEIFHAHGHSFGRVVQGVLEKLCRMVVDDEQAFAQALGLLFLVGQFAFVDFDVVFLGQEAERVVVRQLFMLHDEVDHVAALPATEAFAQPFGGRHYERRGLFVVERAEALVVDTGAAKGDVFRHDVNDLRRVQYPVYGGLVDHRLGFAREITKNMERALRPSREFCANFLGSRASLPA